MSANGAAGHAPERPPLEDECGRFGRYLIGEPPSVYVREWYVRGHVRAPGRFAPSPGLDRTLVALAARPWIPLRGLDLSARLLAPAGALRRKLIFLVGILECVPETAARFEVPEHRSSAGFFLALVGRGVVSVGALAVGLVLIGAARLAGVGRRPR